MMLQYPSFLSRFFGSWLSNALSLFSLALLSNIWICSPTTTTSTKISPWLWIRLGLQKPTPDPDTNSAAVWNTRLWLGSILDSLFFLSCMTCDTMLSPLLSLSLSAVCCIYVGWWAYHFSSLFVAFSLPPFGVRFRHLCIALTSFSTHFMPMASSHQYTLGSHCAHYYFFSVFAPDMPSLFFYVLISLSSFLFSSFLSFCSSNVHKKTKRSSLHRPKKSLPSNVFPSLLYAFSIPLLHVVSGTQSIYWILSLLLRILLVMMWLIVLIMMRTANYKSNSHGRVCVRIVIASGLS